MLDYSISKPYTLFGRRWSAIPPAEQETAIEMRKTLTALLLCAFYLNSASAEIEYNGKDHYLLIQGNEQMTKLHEWFLEHPDPQTDYVEIIQLQNATLHMDDLSLPNVMYFSFDDATLEFNEIGLIQYEVMPQLTVGETIVFPPTTGSLTISLTDTAMKGMLDKKDLSVKVEQPLLQYTFFQEIDDSPAFFVLQDETGKTIQEGETYTYNGQEYTNVGIIYDAGDLHKNEIALLLTGTYDPVGWGMGSFSVVALGPDFVVPEPTTGTLSLLALAALASRRRRK